MSADDIDAICQDRPWFTSGNRYSLGAQKMDPILDDFDVYIRLFTVDKQS